MDEAADAIAVLPRALTEYPLAGDGLLQTLVDRVQVEPFNAVATVIFALAVLHTFVAARFTALAHRIQHEHDVEAHATERPVVPVVGAELLHFLGEIEVIFGLWAVVLLGGMTAYAGWATATHYLNDTVNYTEPLFVVVIMALASTRPIVVFAESRLRRLVAIGGGTPAAWWVTILTIGPIFGSFITEPGAMTICAVLLARQFYDLQPSARLKYATLGLLFVNISIGGTLTHFAAPPVLMVARVWDWDTSYMFSQFGWRAAIAIAISTAVYYAAFRRELVALAARAPMESPEETLGADLLPVPAWITSVHVGFMAWTVFTAHYPVLFMGGFLFFLGFVRATAPFQGVLELKMPLLVGFFLAGLVIHGGLQGWWIAPVLGSLAEGPLFLSAMLLTAFNDNALITYLSTLVPDFGDGLRLAVVQGAVVGGGLTVIANAPNPAGQALLGRFFGDSVSPLGLVLGALVPTLIAAAVFRLL